jgi:hypothetical protein
MLRLTLLDADMRPLLADPGHPPADPWRSRAGDNRLNLVVGTAFGVGGRASSDEHGALPVDSG